MLSIIDKKSKQFSPLGKMSRAQLNVFDIFRKRKGEGGGGHSGERLVLVCVLQSERPPPPRVWIRVATCKSIVSCFKVLRVV